MSLAYEKDMKNVMYLSGVKLGEDHVALEMMTYETDF